MSLPGKRPADAPTQSPRPAPQTALGARVGAGRGWTFLTNHAHVLLCIAEQPAVRMREVAVSVGITERAVQRIVADLEAAGYVVREREGRRNRYRVRGEMPLRHANERHEQVSSLMALMRGHAAVQPR